MIRYFNSNTGDVVAYDEPYGRLDALENWRRLAEGEPVPERGRSKPSVDADEVQAARKAASQTPAPKDPPTLAELPADFATLGLAALKAIGEPLGLTFKPGTSKDKAREQIVAKRAELAEGAQS